MGYREQVEDIESSVHTGLEYFDGFNDAISAAAEIATAADARVVELEAAMRRVAHFLRETDPQWVRVDTDDGPEIATLLGLAMTLEAALAADATGATGAGAGTGGAG